MIVLFFLDNIIAIRNVQKIKNGGTAKLSLSQIVNLNINLVEAKRKLTPQEYSRVYSLYETYNHHTAKHYMNHSEYLRTTIDLLSEFDRLAPYEKYSGNAENTKLLLSALRSKRQQTSNNIPLKLVTTYKQSGKIAEDYLNTMLTHAHNNGIQLDFLKAQQIIGIIFAYETEGQLRAKYYLDLLLKDWVKNSRKEDIRSLPVNISFFLEVLNSNGIISTIEVSPLCNLYIGDLLQKHEIITKEEYHKICKENSFD